MDKVIRDKWVAALRSGHYKQGQARLKMQLPGNTFQYCCLGVLGEVLCESEAESTKWVENNDVAKSLSFSNQSSRVDIPSSLKDYIKLSTSKEKSLIAMNDLRGMSFMDIADSIEQHL